MAGLIGASLGYPMIVIALFLSVFLGAATTLILVILKMKKSDGHMLIVPFLTMGAVVTLFIGDVILDIILASVKQ